MSEITRKITEQLRQTRCHRKNCLSQQKDPPQIVWFGKQYGTHRTATCSACFLCNDQAVKNSVPTQLNILPLSLFVEQFVNEMRHYQQIKTSKQFFPKVLKQKGKNLLAQLAKMEVDINQILNHLASSIVNFCKRVQQANAIIFKHPLFDDIITINSQAKFEVLLDKIVLLIKMLNCDANDAYHFEDLQIRSKKITRLKSHIENLTQRTITVLKEVHELIRSKNELISRL